MVATGPRRGYLRPTENRPFPPPGRRDENPRTDALSRVLVLLSASFPFGRGESFLATEAPWLERAFDEVVVITNDTTSPATHPLADRSAVLRVPYGLTPREKAASLAGLLSPEVWRELAKARRRAPGGADRRVPATVLASWYKARKVARRLRAVAEARPGASVHAYSYWASDMAVAVALARREGWIARGWARAHGWDVYPGREGVAYLPFRDFLARHLDHLFFVSDDGRRAFESLTGRAGDPSLEVMRLGTPRAADEPLARQEPFTVASCSALVPVKRVDRLARALGRLGMPVRWVHLGDGPERAAVEAVVAALPTGVRAELRGHVPHERVLDAWRELRPSVFVNVSASEGVPVAMMEAMSLGIPVVGPRVGGVPEIVSDGENGLLLEADPGPDAVAAALATVAGLPDEAYRRLAEGAHRTWRERYHAEANFGRLLQRVLAADPAAAPVEATP